MAHKFTLTAINPHKTQTGGAGLTMLHAAAMKLRLGPPTLTSKRLWLSVVCVLLSLLACQTILGRPAPTPTPLPLVGVGELQFTNPQTGERFRALDACIRGFAAQGWTATGYQLIGNFYEARWCQGSGARQDCQIASSTENNPDQHAIDLATFFYPIQYPQVFGLSLAALWVPKGAGWGVMFHFSEDGGTIQGNDVSIGFSQYQSGNAEPVAKVSGIGPLMYSLLETSVTAPDVSGLSGREKLALALNSPETMRAAALEAYQALAAEVDADLRSGKITACDRGEYQNNGIQPACTPRPLTPAEQAAELDRATAYFANQQNLLREHYQEMYAALFQAFPFHQCWPGY